MAPDAVPQTGGGGDVQPRVHLTQVKELGWDESLPVGGSGGLLLLSMV